MKDLTPAKADLEAIETASRDEIAALQLERLKWSLRHAYDNVPMYRKRFDEAGVHPDDLRELKEEVKSLKDELRAVRTDIAKALASIRTAPKQGGRRQRPAETMVGKQSPTYSVATIDGKTTKIGGKRDKPQVMFCYASWCGFCKKSLPWIETLHQKYEEKGVEFLLLNLDARGDGGRARTEEQTLQTYKDLNLSMPMTMTTASNDTSKIGAAYKARSFPTLFVLGPSGEVESVHVGAKPGLADIVGKELDLLLQGKNRTSFPN